VRNTGRKTSRGGGALLGRAALAIALFALLSPARGEEDPDYFDLAFIAENNVHIMHVWEDGGGRVKKLTLPEGEKRAMVSDPARRRLAFLFRDGEKFTRHLCVLDLETEECKKIVDFRFRIPRPPAFSPDGKFLCYAGNAEKPGKHEVWAVSLDGKWKKKLSSEPTLVWDGPAFADRGTVLYGTSADPQFGRELWALPLGRGKPKVLLRSRVVPEDFKRVSPGYSPQTIDTAPKRRSILWLDWGDENLKILGVRVATTAGGKSRSITDTKKNVLAARFSPDGRHVAYMVPGEKLGSDVLWVVKSDGKDARKLVTVNKQPYRGWLFSWCPDGKRLAYVHNASKKPGSKREIYTVRIDGGEPVRLTRNQSCENFPVWLERRE
jgi:hypothetical protein